jgi:hypothetical protein
MTKKRRPHPAKCFFSLKSHFLAIRQTHRISSLAATALGEVITPKFPAYFTTVFGGEVTHFHIDIFSPGNLSVPITNYHIPLIDP